MFDSPLKVLGVLQKTSLLVSSFKPQLLETLLYWYLENKPERSTGLLAAMGPLPYSRERRDGEERSRSS